MSRGASACFLFISVLATSAPSRADTIQLYAAGSLRAALTEIAKAFETETGDKVTAKYGASGLLKEEIDGGARADVFASANMEHPQALNAAGKSGPVLLFARNRLCALVKPGLKIDSANLLERMLDPAIKLGTSTPKADPSGDYALEVFAKAESTKPGARATLEKKALQLTGNANSVRPPAGRNTYGWNVGEGRADIFLAYCTSAREAQKQNPEQQILELPESLAVGADYGLTVITGASAAAGHFAQFILSPAGQNILTSHAFGSGQKER
jgi:molybdate transport system substrate-binding protein